MKVVLYKIYFTFYKQIRLLVTSPSGEENINVPQTRLISSEKGPEFPLFTVNIFRMTFTANSKI